jgi:hypothetical protein
VLIVAIVVPGAVVAGVVVAGVLWLGRRGKMMAGMQGSLASHQDPERGGYS